jgi:hypothetical protein
MMTAGPHWLAESGPASLRYDPLPALLAGQDEALSYWVRRDLLGEAVPEPDRLWQNPVVIRLGRKQQADGSWKYAGKADTARQNYSLLETYRHLRLLVEQYGLTREQPMLAASAEYVFSCQTADGDIRGILGNQTMPYYHGAILELLVKAGYDDDARAHAGLEWLLDARQDDGGWIVPAQAVPPRQRDEAFWLGRPVPPDRALPHAHLATGMALRAFAAHPGYRDRPEVTAAGRALKSRLFKPDKYNDRKAAGYWFKFQFPFWWTNLLTALDSLSKLGFARTDPDIARGLAWFVEHQDEDGLWPTGYGKGRRAAENRRWVGLAICRLWRQLTDV